MLVINRAKELDSPSQLHTWIFEYQSHVPGYCHAVVQSFVMLLIILAMYDDIICDPNDSFALTEHLVVAKRFRGSIAALIHCHFSKVQFFSSQMCKMFF